FDGLVLSTPSSAVPSLYNLDFGNVQFGGPVQSWLQNGGIVQVCSAGFQCGNNTYDLIASESLGGDFIHSTALIVNTRITRLYPSDSGPYLLKNPNGRGSMCRFSQSNFFQIGLLDPASDPVCLMPGSDYDASLIGSIAHPKTMALPNLIGYGQDAIG